MSDFEKQLFPEFPASDGIGLLLERNPFAVDDALAEIYTHVEDGTEPEYGEENERYCEAIADYVAEVHLRADDREGAHNAAWLAAQTAVIVARKTHPDYTPVLRLSAEPVDELSDNPILAEVQTEDLYNAVAASIDPTATQFPTMAYVSRGLRLATDPAGQYRHETYVATMMAFGMMQNEEIYQRNQQAAQEMSPEEQAELDELNKLWAA